MVGKLVLCATPIGNLDDMPPRSIAVLREAHVIACEDTRRTRKLMAHFQIPGKEFVVCNEATEAKVAGELARRVARGQTVALVSDAGMPGLSDPGYRLVTECVGRGLKVEAVPGPSAGITALVMSGLPTDRYVFEGFLPRKKGERRRRIEALANEERTIVAYESPHRVEAALRDLTEVLGERRAVLARELTKLYEEVRRGILPELLDAVRADPPKGEIVLVVEGAPREAESVDPSVLAARARRLMDEGVPRKEALSRVAESAGVPRRAVFDSLLEP